MYTRITSRNTQLLHLALHLLLPTFLAGNVFPSPAVTEVKDCRSKSYSKTEDSKIKQKEIRFGLLIPYNFTNVDRSAYESGYYYASAAEIAVDKINQDPQLLSDYCLSYIWSDTECLEKEAIRAQAYQLQFQEKEHKVDAFIGPGCHCKTVANVAGALNIPIISHVSIKSIFHKL